MRLLDIKRALEMGWGLGREGRGVNGKLMES